MDQELTLVGWVHSRRDHGGVIFVDLRDRSGICQIVFNPEGDRGFAREGQATSLRRCHRRARHARQALAGNHQSRSAHRRSGTQGRGLRLLNASQVPPFVIDDETDANENTRLKYRYLDLRRPQSLEPLLLRYRMTKLIRDYLDGLGFIDVETPVLTKSTPEGARDYLVPSRIYHGKFYALPQSPQLFKQILMVGGLDRYFQIVKCFRDEDLRADRQPEFTQLDMELSFVQPEDVMAVVEGMISLLFKELKGIELKRPFAIDLRRGDESLRLGQAGHALRFGAAAILPTRCATARPRSSPAAIQKGGVVKGIRIPNGGAMSRKDLDDMTPFVATFGAKGVAWTKITAEGWQSPIAKFLSEAEQKEVERISQAQVGDVVLFSADSAKIVHDSLGNLRLHLGEKLGLIPEKDYALVWVVDFPLDGIRSGRKTLRRLASSVHRAAGRRPAPARQRAGQSRAPRPTTWR